MDRESIDKSEEDAAGSAEPRPVNPGLSIEFLESLEGIGWDGDLDAVRDGDKPIEW